MFSWRNCDKTATLLGVSSVTVSKVVGTHKSWEDVSEEEQWAKINIDRKRLPYIENRFEKSQNYCSIVTAELNIHLVDRFHKHCPT
jgi:hypothetical protein